MKKSYKKSILKTTLALLLCCALYPTSLLAQEWDKPYPEDWADDDLSEWIDEDGVLQHVVNKTKGLTWYPNGYFYGLIENTFDYSPDEPTETPWIADEEGTVEDYEGNVYRTLRFGDTWWMAENLRTKIILDSTYTDTIQMQLYIDWDGSCDGGIDDGNDSEFMYTHANDDAANDSVYGCLYNWLVGYATLYKSSHLLKEEGWVIADSLDFYNLIRRFELWEYVDDRYSWFSNDYLWTVTSAPSFGLFIKSDRKTLWKSGSPVADEIPYNASGLCFPPAGQMEGTHSGFGTKASIWTAAAVHHTPHEGLGRRYLLLSNESNTMSGACKGYGMARSLRLVKRIVRYQNTTTKSTNTDVTYTATDSIAWCPGYITGYTDTASTSSTIDTTEVTAIAAAIATTTKVWGTQGSIMVQNQEENTRVEIYNISGTLIKTVQLTSGTMQIAVKSGIYIVRVNGIGKKVVVQ